jgi:hypothetical protein
VDFRFGKPVPGGVVLTANWVPIIDMLKEIPPATPMVEPMVRLSRYNNLPMFLARPPKGYPHRDHLLVLHFIEGDPGSGDELLMFFAAAYDPARADGTSPLIGALFPWHPSGDDATNLRSADKKPQPGEHREAGAA